MGLKLYNVDNEIMSIIENTEENANKVEETVTGMIQKNAPDLVAVIQNFEAIIEAKKSEEKRIAESRKIDEKKLERFKDYLKGCMENNGVTKITTALGTLTIAKNPISIDVVDETAVPDEFKDIIFTTKVDKKKIAQAFKETGELIEGVRINTNNTNLRIK